MFGLDFCSTFIIFIFELIRESDYFEKVVANACNAFLEVFREFCFIICHFELSLNYIALHVVITFYLY